jgi:hypothetical protein
MQKPIKHDKRRDDVNQLARHLVDIPTKDHVEPPTKAQISLVMARLGRKGGKKGGKRRLETMTAEERSKIARDAALARWKKIGPKRVK